MEELKKILDAKEAFVNYMKQFEKNSTTTGSDFDVDMDDDLGDNLMDYSKFIKTHEDNIKGKEEAILFMKEFILACVDKISEYNDKIRVSKLIIENTKDKIVDLID